MRNTLRQAVFGFLVLLLVAPGSFTSPSAIRDDRPSSDKSELLEIGRAERLQPVAYKLGEFKIVSYNIRWRSGKELNQLIQLFRNDPEIGNALVLGLQEVDRNKKRSRNANNAKIIANEMGMHYAWAAPPTAKTGQEEETGVALLSYLPLSDVRRLVLPHPGPGRRRRAAIGATIKVDGHNLRVYSVHSETRISVEKKLEQMNAVLKDLAEFPKDLPAVVLGDLNTWDPGAGDKTVDLFSKAKFQTPFNGDSTFCRRLLLFDLKLRLDWIWLRGLTATSYGIDRQIKISDHWPLWAVVSLDRKS